jgi:hypothetical protein
MAGNSFRGHRALLLAACTAFTALAGLTMARAGDDGVIFDGGATDSGVANGFVSIAVSSSFGGIGATTAAGSIFATAIGANAKAGDLGTISDVAIGTNTTAIGGSSTVVGSNSTASGQVSQTFWL